MGCLIVDLLSWLICSSDLQTGQCPFISPVRTSTTTCIHLHQKSHIKHPNILPRAADETRTHDLVLTKDVLYQLSYSSGLSFQLSAVSCQLKLNSLVVSPGLQSPGLQV